MDKIFIDGLKTEAIIGIFDWERQVKQTVVIDLQICANVRKAASSDSIDDTLNYKRLAKRVIEFVEGSQFHLVETLAQSVAMLLLEEFAVEWLRLRLNKPGALRFSEGVGIVIERNKQDLDDWRLRRARN
jgi:7,8-dihydroneopterin aldolase/epimerase/oxygenase